MTKLKNLPTKKTTVKAVKRSPYIRNQHYNPNKNNKVGKIIIDSKLHKDISNKLKDLGVLDNSYYVGGMVRDSILNKPNEDIDIVVEKPTKEMISKLESTLTKTGEDFPVYRMKVGEHEIEIALARKERKSGEGHKGFDVQTGEDIDINKDLIRRDLTINAMAASIKDPNKIIDPYGGQKDLKNKVIRHVSEAFADDPLRVYRTARFAARFSFNVHESTLKLMNKLKGELSKLPPERVSKELNKTFVQSKNPSEFFKVLDKANVLDVWFPEISKMKGIEQPKKYHPEGDVFNHTMETLDLARKYNADKDTMWGALFHDIGKIDTPKDVLPKHIGHDKRGAKYVDKLAKRYKLTNKQKRIVQHAIEFHMNVGRLEEMKPGKVIDYVNRMNKSNTLNSVLLISEADRTRTGGLSDTTHKKVSAALAALNEKIPTELSSKFKRKSGEQIQQLVKQFRIKQYKKYLR